MKFFRNILLVGAAFVMITAGAKENTPGMELFKKFREAAVNNDLPAMLSITDGKLLETLQSAGVIPANTREDAIFISAAYEDIHLPAAEPDKAVVYAFSNRNGRELCFVFSMQKNANGSLKITGIKTGPHSPQPHFEAFISACRSNNIARYRDLITTALAEKHGFIPGSLKTQPANEKIIPGRSSANAASFTLDRDGLRGNILMVRSGYFWKVSAIDAILLTPTPDQMVNEFCQAAKDAESVKKYFDEGDFESVKEQLAGEILARINGVKEIVSTKISGSRGEIKAKTATETESGIISITCKFSGEKWLVAKFDAETLIFKNEFSPEKTAEKFVENFFKTKNEEALKEIMEESLIKTHSEKITEPSPEAAVTIEKEELNGTTAKVTANVENCKSAKTIEFTMTLAEGMWKITGLEITPPPAEGESAEEGTEEAAE